MDHFITFRWSYGFESDFRFRCETIWKKMATVLDWHTNDCENQPSFPNFNWNNFDVRFSFVQFRSLGPSFGSQKIQSIFMWHGMTCVINSTMIANSKIRNNLKVSNVLLLRIHSKHICRFTGGFLGGCAYMVVPIFLSEIADDRYWFISILSLNEVFMISVFFV